MNKTIVIIFSLLVLVMLLISCDNNLINKAKWNEENKEWYYGKSKDNGAQIGKWYTWYPSKKIKSISYNPDGLYTSWYENGQNEIEAVYKNGYILGERKIWFPNGKLKRIEKWNEHKHLTYWKEWDKNSNIKFEAKEIDNKISGDLWYINGYREQQGMYINPGAQWDGYWIFWYENGKKKMEGNYKNGRNIGKHFKWDENGIMATLFFDEKGELLKVIEQ